MPASLWHRSLFVLVGFVSALVPTVLGVEPPPRTEIPAVYGLPAETIRAWRDWCRQDPVHAATFPLQELLRAAEKTRAVKPESVMNKTRVADSGDPHDYFSLAPYWWPDPKKKDGKPYLRRDGDVNPESRDGTDAAAFGRLAPNVEVLALAYYIGGDNADAEHAARLLRTWFLDPATRMNPHLEYAQAIPGRNSGRGSGTLQGRHLCAATDAAALLAESPAWTAEDRAGFRAWLEAYYHWLTTSKTAGTEETAENNHGTWFDVQAAHLALVLGKTEEAGARLRAARTRRLAAQVEPDGRQPRELERTQSLGYSLFNLEAFFALARLGDRAGVDWWSFSTKDGRSLHAALAYVAPWIDPGKPWPKPDLGTVDRARLAPLLAEYLAHREDAGFRALLAAHGGQPGDATARCHLLFTRPPAK